MEKVPNKNDLKAPKLRPISRKRRNIVYLLLAIIFGIIAASIFVTHPPSYKFEIINNISIPILPIFLAAIAGFIYCLITYIFNNKIFGIIISTIVISIIIIRLLLLYF